MLIGVTGATGFLGRYIVDHLTAAGHRCRCWMRSTSDTAGFSHPDRIDWMEGDLNDDDASRKLAVDAEAVVHSALYHPGGGFRGGEGDVIDFAEKNILGSLRLIEAAGRAGVGRFVFISTCAVHERILDDRPLDETHPLWATHHYGAHKAAIEKFVHSYGLGMGFPICALRPTGIYGIARPVTQSKWFGLVGDVVAGRSVEATGGGKEVHAADVAKAVEVLLHADAEKIAGEAFNCCDRPVPHHEVATIAKRLAGSDAEILGQPKQTKHQIETGKIESLGMTFGGDDLLEQTVGHLVEAVRASESLDA